MDYLNQNSLLVVLGIVLVVWFGIITYLLRIEGRIKKMEQQIRSKEDSLT